MTDEIACAQGGIDVAGVQKPLISKDVTIKMKYR